MIQSRPIGNTSHDRLDWSHRDPFDRMLAAQARLGGYALLTVDAAFVDADVDLALPS